jgi:nitrogen-specific signal transduction histidine kinase
MALSLFVTRGNEKGQIFEVSGEGVLLGRNLSNGVCLTDLETSRKHCRISVKDNLAQIIDLGSSNGTFLNGQPISSGTLKIGDHISIGQTVLVVLAKGESTSNPQQPPKRDLDSLTVTPELGEDVAKDGRFATQLKGNLQFIYDASQATSKQEIAPMLDDLLRLMFEWVSADRGCILLRDGPRQPLRVRAMQYRDPTEAEAKFKISSSIARHVDVNNIGVLSSDIDNNDQLKNSASVLSSGISEILCVPVRGRSFGLGLIYIDRLGDLDDNQDSFNQDHLKLMHVIAHLAATAIENDEYYAALLEKERMLAVGETAEKLSHRIMNILQSISGGTHLVETGLNDNSVDGVRMGWEIVKRNQDRMSNLVQDMLLVNQEYVPKPEETNIKQLVMNSVDEHKLKAGPLDISIKLKCSKDHLIANVDSDGIATAIGYVIGEAVKNSRGVEGAEVNVALVTSPSGVEIFVRSAEAEIQDEDQIPQASEIFSAAKEFFPGLELSAAQKILRGHDGGLDIRNEISHEDYRIWFPPTASEQHQKQTIETPRWNISQMDDEVR